MGFLEGRIDEEKLFGDAVFPKTLLPVAEDESSTHSLVEMIRTERDSLSMMLQQHGAILFRGFNVESAEEFDHVVQAFGWDDTDLIHAATRIKLTDRVYTANEAPLDQFINFHHEMSLTKSSPSKIFFFCKEPAPEGGETSIVPSNVIVDKMEEHLPELMAKISEVGLIFRFKTVSDNETDTKTVINKTWKWMLKTDDEVEAEKRKWNLLKGESRRTKYLEMQVFPMTLLLSNSCSANLAEMVRIERDLLAEILHRHGAILFRGFHVDSPEAFDHGVQAFGWDHHDYFGVGGNERVRVTDQVYSVDEAPPQQFINFLHEMAPGLGKILFLVFRPTSARMEVQS